MEESKADHEIEQLSGRFITKTIVGPIFLFFGTFVPIMNLYEKSEYRNLRIDEVSTFKIYKIDDQGRTLFINPRYITDKAITASGLSKMKECTITSKKKWYTLSDGYLIEMYSEDEEYIREFNVYKNTFRIEDGSILRINESYLTLKGASLFDIYSCPSLHNWVNEQIDPMFINGTAK